MSSPIETHIVDELPADAAVMYVVYNSPLDFPGKVVVRRQAAGKGIVYAEKKPHCVADSLLVARSKIPQGLTRITSKHDDAVIVESWL